MNHYKAKLRGTGSVFRFTLLQFFKNKANIFSMIFLLLFSTLMLPLITVFTGAESKEQETATISNVYIMNESGYDIAADTFSQATSDIGYWTNTEFITVTEAPALQENEVQLHISFDSDTLSYTFAIHTANESEVDEDCLSALEALASEQFELIRYQALNISQEQLNLLTSYWSYDTDSVEDYFEDEDAFGTEYFLQLIYSVVLMMVCILSTSYIIRSVIEEKSSKLVETLLVSVEPLALIVGKVLASMAYVVLTLAVMIAGYVLSFIITGLFFEVGSMNDISTVLGVSTDLMNITPISIIAFIVSLLLGYLTFSIIAGLSASGCSNMEESDAAQSGCTMLIMVGYFVAIIATAAPSPALTYISCIVPFLSIFCAPIQYLTGSIGIGALILSWVLQILVIIALAILCGKIYRTLIMHRGNRIGFKEMLAMFRKEASAK